MSKHSKWSKIKNQKGAADVKKSALFTKHIRAIAVAARQGADPANNFQLRVALDAAKAAGVPKDTIDRALSRVAGEGEAEELFEVTYEGFAPGKVAIIIEAVTNNKNRTIGNVRRILEKNNGTLAQNGAVTWQFVRQALEWVPKVRVPVTDPELRAKLDKLYEMLDEDDDVQNYFTNEE